MEIIGWAVMRERSQTVVVVSLCMANLACLFQVGDSDAMTERTANLENRGCRMPVPAFRLEELHAIGVHERLVEMGRGGRRQTG